MNEFVAFALLFGGIWAFFIILYIIAWIRCYIGDKKIEKNLPKYMKAYDSKGRRIK